jgi:hypothetical protein
VLPHIAGEWKASGANLNNAMFKVGRVGASLVYARNLALAYIGSPETPGFAHVTTFCTDGSNLLLFAHHAKLKNGKLSTTSIKTKK